jgi:Arc/MetJ family transcription regulator
MRASIDIDDKLMADAIKASGCRTQKEAVEQGLKLLIIQSQQKAIRKLRSQVKWEGDLDEMRGSK